MAIEGSKIFRWQKGSSQSPGTSSPRLLPFPSVGSMITTTFVSTGKIGLLPGPKCGQTPPQLTTKMLWALDDPCISLPHSSCHRTTSRTFSSTAKRGKYTRHSKKYKTSECHYGWQHTVDDKTLTKGTIRVGPIPRYSVLITDHYVNELRVRVQASEDRKEAGRHWKILAAMKAEWVGDKMRGEAVTGGGGGDPTTTTTNDSRSTTPIVKPRPKAKPTPSY
jgi:hypothetical protein